MLSVELQMVRNLKNYTYVVSCCLSEFAPNDLLSILQNLECKKQRL